MTLKSKYFAREHGNITQIDETINKWLEEVSKKNKIKITNFQMTNTKNGYTRVCIIYKTRKKFFNFKKKGAEEN